MSIDLPLTKIVSGGQSGADVAALDWAIALALPPGGWCPKGRKCESGTRLILHCLNQWTMTCTCDKVSRIWWMEARVDEQRAYLRSLARTEPKR